MTAYGSCSFLKPDYCRGEFKVVAVPIPTLFTIEADSYTCALVVVSQNFPSNSGALLQTPKVLKALELVDEQKKEAGCKTFVTVANVMARPIQVEYADIGYRHGSRQ